MDFHVYDTRLIRKLARYLELTGAYRKHRLDAARCVLVENTLAYMFEDLDQGFRSVPLAEFDFHYDRATELLRAEHEGRKRAAEQRRAREAQRAKERAAAQELIAAA